MDFATFIGTFTNLIKILLPVIVGLALLAFLWGLTKFIFKASEGDIKEGKNLMIWGTVALFVLMSWWGIITFFHSDLGLTGPFGIPVLPTGTR